MPGNQGLDGSRLWLAVMLAALLALVPLAWLQYHWIVQIREAENDRLRAHLREEVDRFVQDLDGDVMRLYRTIMGGGPGAPRTDFPQQLLDRFDRFSADKRIIRNLYYSEGGEQGVQDLYRLDMANERFVKADWPPHLVEHLVNRQPGPFFENIIPEIPALVAPRMQRGPAGPMMPMGRGPGEGRRGRFAGWVILELDMQFLQHELLPDLVKRHFQREGGPTYDVRVVTGSEHKPIFQTAEFATADASAPLLEMRRPFPRFPGPGEGARGPEPAPPRAPWLLMVKQRAGSLEQITAQTRNRNLAVSFAILLVLAVSLVGLLVTTRRAQRLAKLQMEFVAGVSHELRTPLAVICSAAENLADGIVSDRERTQKYGSVIRGEGRRLSKMVEQILRFAGIQSGRAKYELANTDVASLVDQAVAACEPDIQAAGLDFEKRIDPDLPPICADSTSLGHGLRNLVENAVKHGGDGKWLRVFASRANGGVEIRIADRGQGIASDELKHIFDPFYRGRRSVEDQVHGFGLGMALAKRIVEAHSGSIAVESEVGRGTCVVVWIPAAENGIGSTDSAG